MVRNKTGSGDKSFKIGASRARRCVRGSGVGYGRTPLAARRSDARPWYALAVWVWCSRLNYTDAYASSSEDGAWRTSQIWKRIIRLVICFKQTLAPVAFFLNRGSVFVFVVVVVVFWLLLETKLEQWLWGK